MKLIKLVRRGKWEKFDNKLWNGGGAWRCTSCWWGYSFGDFHDVYEFNYCPHCGAKMDGGTDDETD